MYMSIGHILSAVRNTHTMHAWIPIALLPIGPKRVNKILQYSVEIPERQALQTIHDVLTILLKPLSDAACQEGYELLSVDGNVQLCFPKLFCWMADYMENTTIQAIPTNRFRACTTPTEKLGENSSNSYARRCHRDYAIAYDKSDAVSLTVHGVKNMKNPLWSIPNLNPPELVRADILHNVLLEILDHVMD